MADVKGIQPSRNKDISTILFGDDLVIMSDSVASLQRVNYKVSKIITECGVATILLCLVYKLLSAN
jgi:hypothetical protein